MCSSDLNFLVLEWGGSELYEWTQSQGLLAPDSAYLALRQRSEERRVGKECM